MAGPALSLFIYLPPISTPPSYRLHFSLIYPCYYISSGPACHCGRSRPPPPLSNTLQHLLPLHPPTITFPLLHLPLRYIVARLVIVAGPAISSYPCTSLTPPSLLFPLPTSTYQPTPPPLQATGPACHCGWSRLSHLTILPPSSIHTPHLLLSYLGPAYHCGRSRPP